MPESEDIRIHRFSNEVFAATREFAKAKQDAEAARARMEELRGDLKKLAALVDSAPAEAQADLRNTLSEASLEFTYVDSDGELPPSRRLGRYLRELAEF